MVIDPQAAKDLSENPDQSPLDIQRSWQRRAEDNVVIKLEELGLIVPEGEVDKVLQTLVTNLEVTNDIVLDPQVRCRIIPTTPHGGSHDRPHHPDQPRTAGRVAQ
jgi:hypothetical protein